ncbi:unnamed protein product [Lymnaea stagnalis]|uniref:Transmembrane protein n=1 Tax=Lymnaea stagnalis TaxID=6523 RepID=A0AAV2HBT5_LYMST
MDLLQVALAVLIFATAVDALTDKYGSRQSGVIKTQSGFAYRRLQGHLGNRKEREAADGPKGDENVSKDGGHSAEDTSDPQHPGKTKASDVPPRTIIITIQSGLDPGFDQSLHDAFQNQGSPPNNGNVNLVMHKKTADAGDDGEILAVADKDRTDNKTGPQPQKQQVPMAVKPSMQLIGIVVGIVFVGVFVTGFIRWRVKKHLEAKRLRRMGSGKKSSLKKKVQIQMLDTIYECDEATDATSPHQGNKARGKAGNSARYHNNSPQLSTTRRPDSRTAFSEDSCHMSRYRYQPRRSRFDEGWEHDIPMTRYPSHRHEPLSRSPSVDSEERVDIADPVTEPLLSPQDPTSAGQTQIPTHLMAPPGAPTVRRSPSPGRGAMSSIINSWFSISFNRDWVGRRWLERHNLRINDVLGPRQADVEGHHGSNLSVVGDGTDDMSVSSSKGSAMSETESLEDIFGTNSPTSSSFLRPDAVGHTWSRDGLDENANVTSSPCIPDNQNTVTNSTLVNCTNPHNTLDNTSPPNYSLTTNTASPRPPRTPRQGTGYRTRQQRHAVSECVSLNPDYNMNYNAVGSRQPISAFSLAMLGQLQSTSLPATSTPTDREHRNSTSQYGVSYRDNYQDVANGFAHQSGVVIEQLSDGSQIIFLPAPTLPSYHNDHPPPYQQ